MGRKRGLENKGKKRLVRLTEEVLIKLEAVGKKNETYSQIILRCLK